MATAVIYLRVSTKDQAQRGGESEGFSIPAQRDACEKHAKTLGADVIMEFIDAGESARSADRPELQLMLKFLQRQACDYVIVHKVDRLARNRVDDVEINLAIQRSGAKLVSVTENIDETPSGMLMHGIMSSIAEFYSRNLATETRKGLAQKVKNGGTPGMVPFGYLNIRTRTPEGYEVRTVTVDPDRAEHVRWIYDAYGSGEWTMTQIREELERRGVTSLPRPKRPAKPMAVSHIENLLSNRYYLGFVKFEGAWHPGRHEPLIDEETWERVQAVRAGRVRTREKPQQHPHYLKGTLYCGHCGDMLGVEIVRNSTGTRYPYFYCLGRKTRRRECSFKAVAISTVEALIEEHWATRELPATMQTAIREDVVAYLDVLLPYRDKRVRAAEQQMKRLTDERDALLRAHYAGAVPLDQLRSEQERISSALASAQRELTDRQLTRDQLQGSLNNAIGLLNDSHSLYLGSHSRERRAMNQAVFDRLYIYDEAVDAQLSDLFELLLAPDLKERLDEELTYLTAQDRESTPKTSKSSNLHPDCQDTSSNFRTLVAGTGFEPATSGL
ncbi:recombinase family protein [Mycolicibacterium peregrinum]|uniref:recombinase family protein n=1 Tax=Mycolicibacterium peregrinum TaxID=43304 RepID=UPI003AAFFD2B